MKLNVSEYINFLDYSSVTCLKILSEIKSYSLIFSQKRIQKVEWGIKFPMFIKPFYTYVYKNQTVPCQIDFYNFYINSNKSFFNDKNFDDETMDGLKARVFRTYPSIVRDLHFSTMLKENLDEVTVLYNTKLDIENDIDVLVITENKLYSFSLYTDTKIAKEARDRKKFRHKRFSNVNYIELPVIFNDRLKYGDFFLYGRNELELVKNAINS